MERRDDIGAKVIIGGMVSVLLIFITLFINVAWSTANEGKTKAYEVGERLTKMESRFDSFQSDLVEIKDLLKRKIP